MGFLIRRQTNMAIIIQSIERLADDDQFLLTVEVDGEIRFYRGGTNSDGTYSGVDSELFFLLSERALAEHGNSAVYHVELIGLFARIVNGKPPGLPIVLGSETRS